MEYPPDQPTDRGRSQRWTRRDIPPQNGKRAVVTGATNGIGWNTALELARAGAEVVVPGRTLAKAEEAKRRIVEQVPAAAVATATMDLTDLHSVRRFAEELKDDGRPVDLLVNNAGIMAVPRRSVSVDGLEMQFATNVAGPFVLTGTLLPALLAAPSARVVTVASYAHNAAGPVPLTDLNSQLSYSPVKAYAKTKLANILVARELQRRAGQRLLSACCHPGYSRTNLQFNEETFLMKVTALLLLPFSQSSAQGAEPTLFAATAAAAKPGGYYGPTGLFGLRGPLGEAHLSDGAQDQDAGRQVFEQLEDLFDCRYQL